VKGPWVIIVTGAPATGKTTLGRRIAHDLGWPFFHKDGIKEALFDTLGWGDREWSKRLGHAAMVLLFYFVEAQLQAGRSLVVEANFNPAFDTARFLALRQQYPFEPLQIVCETDGATLRGRYRARAASSERHPGHVDGVLANEFDFDDLCRKHAALDIGGRVVRVDTSDFDASDHAGVLNGIREALEA